MALKADKEGVDAKVALRNALQDLLYGNGEFFGLRVYLLLDFLIRIPLITVEDVGVLRADGLQR